MNGKICRKFGQILLSARTYQSDHVERKSFSNKYFHNSRCLNICGVNLAIGHRAEKIHWRHLHLNYGKDEHHRNRRQQKYSQSLNIIAE